MCGRQPTRLLLVARRPARSPGARLAVTVGTMTVVVYDRTALAGYLAPWAQAADYGKQIFSDPEPDAFDELAERDRRRELRHFERSGRPLSR